MILTIQPNLVAFTQSPDMVHESTSYFVQQMFSANRGNTIKEVKSDAPFGPVYWVASSADDTYFVKLANFGQETQEVTVTIDGLSSGKLTVVADDDPKAYNSDAQTLVTPSEKDTQADGGRFSFALPAWSVAVLTAR